MRLGRLGRLRAVLSQGVEIYAESCGCTRSMVIGPGRQKSEGYENPKTHEQFVKVSETEQASDVVIPPSFFSLLYHSDVVLCLIQAMAPEPDQKQEELTEAEMEHAKTMSDKWAAYKREVRGMRCDPYYFFFIVYFYLQANTVDR